MNVTLPDSFCDDISYLLTEIHKLFKPGCICTIIMRRPGEPNHEMVVGNDDLRELIATIERRIAEDVQGVRESEVSKQTSKTMGAE